ncbi:hypothetical protein F5148DRAFT_725498 [Russula earlei]|uniref:Uncharacterized protein n=1 Tax=Russula earlei TaxID=71964 RepID=A0ACC0UD57_9AGAM|nr:hypothetical protein F5148DRAFT_725498 [Russula earlei]
MVIDAKLPPEDSAPLTAPPPAYAPLSGDARDPARSAPNYLQQQQQQQYPPSSNQAYSSESPPLPTQWQTAGTGLPSLSQDEWLGRQYRDQLLAQCARGNHVEITSFGLCGIICAILLFPIGLIFLCIDAEKKCSRCGKRLN